MGYSGALSVRSTITYQISFALSRLFSLTLVKGGVTETIL